MRQFTLGLFILALVGCSDDTSSTTPEGDPGSNMGDTAGSGDPTAGDPVAGDPVAGDPVAGDPTAGDPNCVAQCALGEFVCASGSERACVEVNGCRVLAAASSCDDGIACTTDSCAEPGGCQHVPDDGQCGCAETCDMTLGCTVPCTPVACGDSTFECGDCLDNDGDCAVDAAADTECTGPCDDSETGLHPELPAWPTTCAVDCFFDGDSSSGVDDCFWDFSCDPLELAPNYDPVGPGCEYDPGTTVGGTMSCSQAQAGQSSTCLDVCGRLTPNGCDCFGCCEFAGSGNFIYLASTVAGEPSCTLADVNDPAKCKPCTPVSGCYNACETCELCFGKTELPPTCTCQECGGAQTCGFPCDSGPCPSGEGCVSGCCAPVP